jgi:ATP-dependent helicase/nuclease subunit A
VRPVPVDEAARESTRRDHARSLVLEAGAGTGKTTLLVDRIEALILTGHAKLEEIAAVTFTENAATTMKLRLRERLERALLDAPSEQGKQRATLALEVLERAQVSTIHALCAAILGERPLECGVIPGFRTADEAQADLLFDEAWEEWLALRLIAGDETLADALDQEIPLEGERGIYGERTSLRGLARTLIEERDLAPLVSDQRPDPEAWRAELIARASRARELAAAVAPGDTLGTWLPLFADFADAARFLQGKELLAHLARLKDLSGKVQRNYGHKPRWPSPEALAEGRAIVAWAKDACESWGAVLSAWLHARIVGALSGVVGIYVRKKQELGLLDFLDLLLKARNALRDRTSVREYFRGRFRFLIIDEFQDTDPLQVDIAQRLAGEVPGALVVVGDTKQSIYRFRRAEVALFRRLSHEAAQRPGHAVLHLTQNFRSRPAILRFVNRAFATLMPVSEQADQPAYEPIAPPPGLPEEPSVIALRFAAPFAEGTTLLEAEAGALAALVRQAALGRYQVRDPASGETRPSRPGDVMILARRLTQIRFLEQALEAAGLRFTVEGGKSFFDRHEVHETLAVLHALDDPSDRVALVAALRSSFFGVSDRDLVAYRLAGGWLSLGEADAGLPGGAALAPAFGLLLELHRARTRLSVAALLERLYEETRILAALTGTRRGEAQIANLHKVVALARQATELGVLTVRGFTRFLEQRFEHAGEEPDLPATRPGDTATVRILSIHKAKGLEAPLVAVYDSADDYRTTAESIPLWDEQRIAVGFRRGCQPPGWDELKVREEARAWAEARRLLYVACTRARDWLVIPCPPRDARPGNFWRDLVALLPATSDEDVVVVDADTLPVAEREHDVFDFKALASAQGPDAVAARWKVERRDLLAAGALRPFLPIAAARAAAREAPPAAFTPGGRGGRDFGSLVHRLLEWTPFDEATPAGLRTMAAALAPSFALDSSTAARAADAAGRALALPVMERARNAPRVWRELRLWFPAGDELVEGVVDLVFEEGGELVVVDYKTDHIAPEQAIAQAAHHAGQLQLYGRGLVQATGMRIRERLVLFTTTGQAVPV